MSLDETVGSELGVVSEDVVAVVSTHSECFSGIQYHVKIAMPAAFDFLDTVEVNHSGSMDPRELAGIERFGKRGEG